MALPAARSGADGASITQEANLNVKAAAASEQELKAECSSLRLAVDAARQAAAARGAECMRLQQSLHSSRCELAELAAAHRCVRGCTPTTLLALIPPMTCPGFA